MQKDAHSTIARNNLFAPKLFFVPNVQEKNICLKFRIPNKVTSLLKHKASALLYSLKRRSKEFWVSHDALFQSWKPRRTGTLLPRPAFQNGFTWRTAYLIFCAHVLQTFELCTLCFCSIALRSYRIVVVASYWRVVLKVLRVFAFYSIKARFIYCLHFGTITARVPTAKVRFAQWVLVLHSMWELKNGIRLQIPTRL